MEETALSSAARRSPWQPSHSPPPKGNHQASGCLEKGGTVDQRPWDRPYPQKTPQAPVPRDPCRLSGGRSTDRYMQ